MTFPRPSLSWIGNALFLLIVATAVGITLLSRQTEILGWRGMIVRSGSMAPAISTGSVILVQSQPSYEVGDIVTFRSSEGGQQLITHRITDKKVENWQGQFITRGDANPADDTQPIRNHEIVGKTRVIIPGLGYVMSFLQSPLGVTLAIVIPATVLIYEQLKNIRHTFQHRGKSLAMIAALAVTSFLPLQHTMAVYANTALIANMNMSTTRWMNPSVQTEVTDDTVFVSFDDAGGTDRIFYQLTYQHEVEGETLEEVIEGEIAKDLSDNSGDLPEFYLGTCSDEVCTPHFEVSDLEITLKFFSGETEVHHFEENL